MLKDLHISYIVSKATETEVSASISTPVLPKHLTKPLQLIIFFLSSIKNSISILVRFKLCANGIKSEVLFAAWIPASLDVDSTSPFLFLFSIIALIISLLSIIDP